MKLKKQFADFYNEITIDTEVEDLKEKRETLEKDFRIIFHRNARNTILK